MVSLVCAIEPVGTHTHGWEGHEWVWVLGEWAGGTLLGWLVGTEHWLRFHMLVSPWMVVDSDLWLFEWMVVDCDVWWFDRSRWKHAETGPEVKVVWVEEGHCQQCLPCLFQGTSHTWETPGHGAQLMRQQS